MPSSRYRILLTGLLIGTISLGASPAQNGTAGRARVEPGETVGVPWSGAPGVREAVRDIMEREARAPKIRAFPRLREEPNGRPGPIRENPAAPPVSRWPPPSQGAAVPGQATILAPDAVTPLTPQVVGTSFKAISLLAPNESQFIPPDSV